MKPFHMRVENLDNAIEAIARSLGDSEARARALGLFTGHRELLTCPKCGLLEDILIGGTLVTYHEPSLEPDNRPSIHGARCSRRELHLSRMQPRIQATHRLSKCVHEGLRSRSPRVDLAVW